MVCEVFFLANVLGLEDLDVPLFFEDEGFEGERGGGDGPTVLGISLVDAVRPSGGGRGGARSAVASWTRRRGRLSISEIVETAIIMKSRL
jgi:hypothetical protein